MSAPQAGAGRFRDLGTRVASGIVLAAIAFAAVWLGGVAALALVTAALVVMFWELHRMATGDGGLRAPPLLAMAAAGIAASLATFAAPPLWGFACLIAGALAVVLLALRHRGLLAAGVIYMGVPLCALLALRVAGPDGARVILWLVLVVAAADIGAYFAGRLIGGPKLAPAISPGKTRSGAVGGLIAAGLTGLLLALAFGWGPGRALMLGIGVAVASQAGDLVESAVKRRFDVKDASNLIPGHGGVMDRLDALTGGVWFYVLWTLIGSGVNGA